jgi:hypothetical protein
MGLYDTYLYKVGKYDKINLENYIYIVMFSWYVFAFVGEGCEITTLIITFINFSFIVYGWKQGVQ